MKRVNECWEIPVELMSKYSESQYLGMKFCRPGGAIVYFRTQEANHKRCETGHLRVKTQSSCPILGGVNIICNQFFSLRSNQINTEGKGVRHLSFALWKFIYCCNNLFECNFPS